MLPTESIESSLKNISEQARMAANRIINDGEAKKEQKLILENITKAQKSIKSILEASQKLNIDSLELIKGISSALNNLSKKTKQYFDICTRNPHSVRMDSSITKSAHEGSEDFQKEIALEISKFISDHLAAFFLETHDARAEASAFSKTTRIAIEQVHEIKSEMIDFIEKNQANLAGISFFKQQKEHRSRQYLWFTAFLTISICTATLIVGLGCANIPLPAAGPMAIPSIWDYFTIAKRAAFVVLALSALSVGMKITFNQFISERKIADIYRNKISIIQHFRTAIRSQTDEATKNAMHLELMKTLYADIPYSSQDHNMEFNVAPVMNIAESLTKKATDK